MLLSSGWLVRWEAPDVKGSVGSSNIDLDGGG